jgi:hypothetical protein
MADSTYFASARVHLGRRASVNSNERNQNSGTAATALLCTSQEIFLLDITTKAEKVERHRCVKDDQDEC